MKDEDYEELLRIYDPSPGFEVRTTPMQIMNKHNPSRFRNKELKHATFPFFVCHILLLRADVSHALDLRAHRGNTRLSCCV